jgi:hypothetical protein
VRLDAGGASPATGADVGDLIAEIPVSTTIRTPDSDNPAWQKRVMPVAPHGKQASGERKCYRSPLGA